MPDDSSDRADRPSLRLLRPPSEEFVQQFTRHQRRLYLFILSQVSSTQDAEEMLQETNVIIWSKYHQFDVATNFFAWAAQIATYEVLKFRQRRHREKLRFSDEFVEAVSRDVLERSEELEQRRHGAGTVPAEAAARRSRVDPSPVSARRTRQARGGRSGTTGELGVPEPRPDSPNAAGMHSAPAGDGGIA